MTSDTFVKLTLVLAILADMTLIGLFLYGFHTGEIETSATNCTLCGMFAAVLIILQGSNDNFNWR